MGGMAEVELGNLAQQNAQNDDVKQFGARMVQDHTAANQQLMPILAAKDFTVPQQLDEKHRRTLDRLSKMRGAEFDRAYMRDMVQDHEKDVKKFRQEAQHGNDPDLKGFAQQTLPVLEQHLKMAHDTSKSLTAVGSSGQPVRATGTADRRFLIGDLACSRGCFDSRQPRKAAQARSRTGGTSRGISRLQPVAALISSTETPGAISRNAMPSGVTANSP